MSSSDQKTHPYSPPSPRTSTMDYPTSRQASLAVDENNSHILQFHRDDINKGVVNASSVACNMERDPWGGPSVLMWSRIGLSFKRKFVIFQSIGEGKDNGVMGALYIDQGLIPYVGPLERHFPPWQRSCSFWKNHNQNNMVVMPWPALNPGYNLIEHRWSEIQKRLDEVQERSTTAAKLGAFFIRI